MTTTTDSPPEEIVSTIGVMMAAGAADTVGSRFLRVKVAVAFPPAEAPLRPPFLRFFVTSSEWDRRVRPRPRG